MGGNEKRLKKAQIGDDFAYFNVFQLFRKNIRKYFLVVIDSL